MAALADDDQPLASGGRYRDAIQEKRPRRKTRFFGRGGRRRTVRGPGRRRRGEKRGEGGAGAPANPRANRGDGDGLRPAAASGGLRGAAPPA